MIELAQTVNGGSRYVSGLGCPITRRHRLLVVAMALLFVGCQSSAPGRGLLHQQIHPESDVSANAEQARLRIRVLVEPFCGRVASTADQIRASTTNQTIRREALLWKIQAVWKIRVTAWNTTPDSVLLINKNFPQQLAATPSPTASPGQPTTS